MNEIKVSVIVPVYKVEKYLDRCIQSIFKQKYKNLEIILVDDGSPDSCGLMCDGYAVNDARVRVIHKENGGLSSARNAGIKIATGDYLCFVDSDDWISSDMIEHMIHLVEKHDAEIVSVSYTLATTESVVNSSMFDIKVMDRNEALEYFLEVGMKSRVSDYPVCIKAFKRELFDDVEFPIDTLYEDYTTNVLLMKKCNTYVKSTKVCYYYFQGGSSIVRSGFKMKDSQLISQCEKVCDMVNSSSYKAQVLAEEKLRRSYMSLLAKIAIYGFDESISDSDVKIITRDYTKKVRVSFKKLLKSEMPISRKVLLTVLCIDYRLLQPIRVIKGRKV